jgi:hypothetical protein
MGQIKPIPYPKRVFGLVTIGNQTTKKINTKIKRAAMLGMLMLTSPRFFFPLLKKNGNRIDYYRCEKVIVFS